MGVKEFNHQYNKIPYYHFIYEGEFFNELKAKNMVLVDGTRINSLFNQKTFEQYDFTQPFVRFKKAAMFFIHYFSDQIVRDLDNYIYKPVIDSIRKTGIFFDDNWQHLSLFLMGDHAAKEKIEVFLVPHNAAAVFMSTCLESRFQEELVSSDIVYNQNNMIQIDEKYANKRNDEGSFW